MWEQRERIANIPSILVWGMKDIAFSPKDLTTFEGFLKNYQTIKLEYVGHYPQEEAKEILIQTLQQNQ